MAFNTGRVGAPSCALAPQALEELELTMTPAPLSELLPALRSFPRLTHFKLHGQLNEGWPFPAAGLRHLPALESLSVDMYGSVSVAEPLPGLTSLMVGSADRVKLGTHASLPGLRSLELYYVKALVLRCSLPQLTGLHIGGDYDTHETAHVSAS